MPISFQVFSSPIGEILVAGTGLAIAQIKWGRNKPLLSETFQREHKGETALEASSMVRQACNALLDYLEGRASQISLPMQVEGTAFQRRVWQKLSEIPYGQTLSYSDVAASIGMPAAFRAVANACGSNPLPLLIPCHRVVHKSGNVSGFAWGVEAKTYLLELERGNLPVLSQSLRRSA